MTLPLRRCGDLRAVLRRRPGLGLAIVCWSAAASGRPLAATADALPLRPGPPPPAGYWEAETEAKKSRFVARLAPIATIDEARKFRSQVSDNKVSHNCWAAVAANGDAGSSDDGEPAGTAGMPMRNVLMGGGRRSAVVVVTRYYGGTKLGTGGLVRAYSEATRAAVEAAAWEEVRPGSTLAVSGVPPVQISRLYSMLSSAEGSGAELRGDGVAFRDDGSADVELWVPEDGGRKRRGGSHYRRQDSVKIPDPDGCHICVSVGRAAPHMVSSIV